MIKFLVTSCFMGAGACMTTAIATAQNDGPVWTFVLLGAVNLMFGILAMARLERKRDGSA